MHFKKVLSKVRQRYFFLKHRKSRLKSFKEIDLKNKVLLVGDSHIEFLEQYMINENVICLGISGERVTGLNKRIDRILATQPKKIICLIGINDVVNNVSFKQTSQDFLVLNNKLRNSVKNYCFIEIMPLGISRGIYNNAVKRLNEFLDGNVFPLTSIFKDSEKFLLPDGLSDDDLHLNKKGYTYFIKQIATLLDE
jgi:lysophospholipase L1-like esterase